MLQGEDSMERIVVLFHNFAEYSDASKATVLSLADGKEVQGTSFEKTIFFISSTINHSAKPYPNVISLVLGGYNYQQKMIILKKNVFSGFGNHMIITDEFSKEITNDDYANLGISGIISKLKTIQGEEIYKSQLKSKYLPATLSANDYRLIYPQTRLLPETLAPGK